jgi:hypothetical protein
VHHYFIVTRPVGGLASIFSSKMILDHIPVQHDLFASMHGNIHDQIGKEKTYNHCDDNYGIYKLELICSVKALTELSMDA